MDDAVANFETLVIMFGVGLAMLPVLMAVLSGSLERWRFPLTIESILIAQEPAVDQDSFIKRTQQLADLGFRGPVDYRYPELNRLDDSVMTYYLCRAMTGPDGATAGILVLDAALIRAPVLGGGGAYLYAAFETELADGRLVVTLNPPFMLRPPVPPEMRLETRPFDSSVAKLWARHQERVASESRGAAPAPLPAGAMLARRLHWKNRYYASLVERGLAADSGAPILRPTWRYGFRYGLQMLNPFAGLASVARFLVPWLVTAALLVALARGVASRLPIDRPLQIAIVMGAFAVASLSIYNTKALVWLLLAFLVPFVADQTLCGHYTPALGAMAIGYLVGKHLRDVWGGKRRRAREILARLQ